MTKQNTVYISLGSNKGDKFGNLQKAIDAVFVSIGNVKQIAKVYKTEALGFDGDDFLNTCIAAETLLDAEIVLAKLQEIELKLGRVKTKDSGYESREIDLDIIFYNDEIISKDCLNIPHLQAHKRQFVLQPLHDICSDYVHPKLNQSVIELLETCEDNSVIEPQNIWLKNPKKKYQTNSHNYIAIEGNIGAGKTSLAHLIANEFNAKLILERFADNPFLPKFYEDASRFAFTLEMSFLADRYQQITDDLAQLDLFSDFMISDYDIFKSLIFSK